MSEHFIKHIKIKKYKCFEDFRAEGFARVNLITGKNNVGKTALMEACFLLSNIGEIINFVKKEYKATRSVNSSVDVCTKLIVLLQILQQNRDREKFNLEWTKQGVQLQFDDFEIEVATENVLQLKDGILQHRYFAKEKFFHSSYSDDREGCYLTCSTNINPSKHQIEHQIFDDLSIHNKEHGDAFKAHTLPDFKNYTFVSINGSVHYLNNLIDELKLSNQLDGLNDWLKKMFEIDMIDVIKNEVMLKKKGGNYRVLSSFGDGTRQVILTLISLLINKNKVIYIDEIDNGIHYSKLDELWEVILKVSKELNVQVFATTHSKECLESYARVAQKLADKEVTLTQLVKVKSGVIKAGVFGYKVLENAISQQHEVRG